MVTRNFLCDTQVIFFLLHTIADIEYKLAFLLWYTKISSVNYFSSVYYLYCAYFDQFTLIIEERKEGFLAQARGRK